MKKEQIVKIFKLISMVSICFVLSINSAHAYEVLDNDKIRFGTGSEASVNATGALQQPFYYDATLANWYKLTYNTYPLDIALAIDGDGSSDWNTNGTILDTQTGNYILTGQVLDVSGFTVTSGSKGYGSIVSTGTVTIAGKAMEIENTYVLETDKSFVTITTKVTNNSGAAANNLRIWVGTRDDWVGTSDGPTKERGNLVGSGFEIISNAADQAPALRIKTADTGVLFYSTSPKAYTSINSCCSFSNAYNQNPTTAAITATGDGSYALFIRMEDLADGESEEFTWYYAAGQLADLDAIAQEVANAAIIAKTLDEDSVLSFTETDFIDSSDVPFTKIQIDTLPGHGVLELGGSVVSTDQEILQADYVNLSYTPNPDFNGSDSFDWKAWDSTNTVYLAATTANLVVTPVNDAPTGLVIITGTPLVNETLTADASALIDVDGLTAFSYQWKRELTDIGADSPNYVLIGADVGLPITVTVSYTDAGGTGESVTSAAIGGVDSDNDGISDAVEGYTTDADNDGIPDYLDVADDAGILHGGDSDGDGIPDAGECPAFPDCADSDGDLIPDYLDSDNAVVSEDAAAIKTNSSGLGSLGPFYLLAIASLWLLRQKKIQQTAVLLFSVVCMSVSARAETESNPQAGTYYAGFGSGVSILQPETTATIFDLTDDKDLAASVILGYRYSPDWMIEGMYSNLGKAKLSTIGNPVGRVEYRVLSIGAIYKAFDLNQYHYPLALHLKVGFAKVNSDANVPEDSRSNNINLGTFLEYALPDAARLRIGYDSYGEDAGLVGMSIVMDIR